MNTPDTNTPDNKCPYDLITFMFPSISGIKAEYMRGICSHPISGKVIADELQSLYESKAMGTNIYAEGLPRDRQDIAFLLSACFTLRGLKPSAKYARDMLRPASSRRLLPLENDKSESIQILHGMLRGLHENACRREPYDRLCKFVETYEFLTPEFIRMCTYCDEPYAERYRKNVEFIIREAQYYLKPCVARGYEYAADFDLYFNELLKRIARCRTRKPFHSSEDSVLWDTIPLCVQQYAMYNSPSVIANTYVIFANLGRLDLIQLYIKGITAMTTEEFNAVATKLKEEVDKIAGKYDDSEDTATYIRDPWRQLIVEREDCPVYAVSDTIELTDLFD